MSDEDDEYMTIKMPLGCRDQAGSHHAICKAAYAVFLQARFWASFLLLRGLWYLERVLL